MSIFLLFLDGVGLGEADPTRNPFAAVRLPALEALVGGPLLADGVAPRVGARATLFPTDAALGVPGRPQSATGQAMILTGRNVSAALGEHWGPKPDARVRAALDAGSLFSETIARGGTAALLNAYPERYFSLHDSGKHLYSSVPYAALRAGLTLCTTDDLRAGRALSADFTGAGWRTELGISDAPVYMPDEAGRRTAALARRYSFSFFDGWVPDMLGHRQALAPAVAWLTEFDAVLAGLLAAWDDDADTLVITSDHGNLEDLSVRTHTLNLVPTIVLGAARARLAAPIRALTDIAPAILSLL